jgi:hypothetical protein
MAFIGLVRHSVCEGRELHWFGRGAMFLVVIPAQAGIQRRCGGWKSPGMDPRLRGDADLLAWSLCGCWRIVT